MALEITRFLKKDGVPFKEVLTFVTPNEVGMVEDDPRLIELENQKGKWFWYLGVGLQSADKNFLNPDVDVKDKEWNPYKHELLPGVTISSKEEYDLYYK